MLKALVRKQFLELNAFYFMNRKTGKRRSTGGTIGYVLLFVFVFLSAASMFFFIGGMLADSFVSLGLDWLYFAMMGMLAILLGTIGSAFNTYTSLYHAKDNELLLSMPVPAGKILFVRMLGVFASALLYTAIAWLPAVVVYWCVVVPSAGQIVFPLLLTIIITFFVTVFTCLLGWLVALVASRLKNKNFVILALSLLFFGAYYFVCFRLNQILSSLAANAEKIGMAVRGWIYPIYQLGLAGAGSGSAFLIFTAITAVLFAVCLWVMSRSFVKIITMKHSEKKAQFRQESVKTSSVKTALLRRELKRFTSSPTYMLNCGLGLVILPIAAILLLIKAPIIYAYIPVLAADMPWLEKMFPALVLSGACMTLSMNMISAPSVSLEGKNLWIIRSLPVNSWDILRAKERLHIIINCAPAILSVLIMGLALKCPVAQILEMVVVVWVFIHIIADVGLWMNLLRPNLTWTSEAVPVKQGLSVLFSMLIGWLLAAILAVFAILFYKHLSLEACLAVVLGVLVLIYRLLNSWLKTKGVSRFENL